MIYLAGPLDYLKSEPESRHMRVGAIVADMGWQEDIWCPSCRYDPEHAPSLSVHRNMYALEQSWAVICEWDATRQLSFGTPVELWHRRGRPGTIVVGTLGSGLFARVLQDEVIILPDWERVPEALEVLRP